MGASKDLATDTITGVQNTQKMSYTNRPASRMTPENREYIRYEGPWKARFKNMSIEGLGRRHHDGRAEHPEDVIHQPPRQQDDACRQVADTQVNMKGPNNTTRSCLTHCAWTEPLHIAVHIQRFALNCGVLRPAPSQQEDELVTITNRRTAPVDTAPSDRCSMPCIEKASPRALFDSQCLLK